MLKYVPSLSRFISIVANISISYLHKSELILLFSFEFHKCFIMKKNCESRLNISLDGLIEAVLFTIS